MDFIFNTLWGWWGVAIMVAIGCGIAAWIFPTLRVPLIAVAGVFISAASLVTKGRMDEKKAEAKRREEALKKVQEKYDEIDKRPDTDDDVAKRLRDGTF